MLLKGAIIKLENNQNENKSATCVTYSDLL